MNDIATIREFELRNLEDIGEYSAQVGWDITYTQLHPGLFNGSYIERIGGPAATTSESYSVPTCIRAGGIPGYVGLGILLSDSPAKVNGMELDPNSFFTLMPGSDVCVITTGPSTAHVVMFDESELEKSLGENYFRIKKSVANVQVFRANLRAEIDRFKNWFLAWLSNPTNQDENMQRYLSQHIYEVELAAMARIGENLENDTHSNGLKPGRCAEKSVLELIDNFYSNPENPLTTTDMCSILDTSRRNLYYNFKRYTGYTPHQVFKHIRLQAVQRDLSRQAGNVTDIATKYNFFHLSEFSALYKNTFGELPSESLKSASFSATD